MPLSQPFYTYKFCVSVQLAVQRSETIFHGYLRYQRKEDQNSLIWHGADLGIPDTKKFLSGHLTLLSNFVIRDDFYADFLRVIFIAKTDSALHCARSNDAFIKIYLT